MKRVLLLIVFLLIGLQGVFGQVDYAYLIFSRQVNYSNFSVFSLSVRDPQDFENYYATTYKPINQNNGKIEYRIAEIESTFNNLIVSYNGDSQSSEDCKISEEYNVEKSIFSRTLYFGSCDFIITMYPLHVDSLFFEAKCMTEKINLSSGYDWQFSFEGKNWIDFPSALNKKQPTFTLEELYNQSNIEENIWKNKRQIKFRTGYKPQNFYTNVVTLNITDCSPSLLKDPEPIDITCNGSQDGSVRLTFDRPLDASKDERMLVYPLKKTDIGEWDPVAPQVILKAGNLAADNSYTLLREVIKPGQYKMAWISKYGTDPTATPNSDEQSKEFEIKEPDPITATIAITNVTCNGGNDGSIQVTNVQGGNSGYQYSLDNQNWQTSNVFKNLGAKTYNIYIKDAKGCSVSFIQEIIEPPRSADIARGNSQNPTYPEKNDGFINIIGKEGYTYQWTRNGVNYSTAKDINNLGPGTYIVTAKDKNGCPLNTLDEVVLKYPKKIAISFSTVPEKIKCYGQTVNITANVTGGTAPYTYKWSTGETDRFIYNKGEGTYTLTVTDYYNNEETSTYTIVPLEPIEVIDEKVTQIKCKGAESGGISLTIEGGTSPYKVYWTSNDSNFKAEGATISNLKPGFYYYEIRDANATEGESNGCTINNNDNPIEIKEPFSSLQVTENQSAHKNNNIFGGTNGALEVNAEGGTGAYTYTWIKEGAAYSGTTNMLSNLPAGNYQVTVTDENDCTAQLSEPIKITQPDKLLIATETINPVAVECNGFSTGSITVEAEGGIPPYHYKWEQEGNPDFSTSDSPTIENLPVGNYRVTVTDESGSTASFTTNYINIKEPLAISITERVITDNLCYSDTQGAIDITVEGGTGAYTFTWSNGETSEDISALMSGDYTVTITDENNCEYTETFHVGQPEGAINLVVDEHTNSTGFGFNDGAIAITISGGTPPYSYEWFSDNGFTSEEEDITNLKPGNYTLVVKDANANAGDSNNCSIVKDFEISEPEKLVVKLEEVFSLLCKGDTDGEIHAQVNGGITPYTYTWYKINNGAQEPININEATLTDLKTGIYQVKITDANGVEQTSEIHTLTEPEGLEISLESLQDVLCYGTSTGSIDIEVTGGTPPYAIYWSNNATTEDINNLSAGNYTVTVKDANGCWIESTYEVKNAFTPIEATNIEITHASKYRGEDGAISLEIIGGKEPYQIMWTRLENQQNLGNGTSINKLKAGTYQLHIIDANRCSLTNTYEVTQPDIVEETITNPTCFEGCDGSISVIVNKGDGNFTYNWSTGATTPTITGLCAGSYSVRIEGFEDETLERTYEIINPAPLIVDLGVTETTLCVGQTRTIDATIEDANATYYWSSTNGFTSNQAKVTLSASGVYEVLVVDSKGCEGSTSVTIVESPKEIAAEFFVSSQVFEGERFTAVDVTNPVPDSIEWILPSSAQVVESNQDFVELYFETSGVYEVLMLTKVGDCEAYESKQVTVLKSENGTEEGGIDAEREKSYKSFLVFPNPTNGQFTVSVALEEQSDITLRVFNVANNNVVAQEKREGQTEYKVTFNISTMPSGMYVVVLETAHSNAVRKLIKG